MATLGSMLLQDATGRYRFVHDSYRLVHKRGTAKMLHYYRVYIVQLSTLLFSKESLEGATRLGGTGTSSQTYLKKLWSGAWMLRVSWMTESKIGRAQSFS